MKINVESVFAISIVLCNCIFGTLSLHNDYYDGNEEDLMNEPGVDFGLPFSSDYDQVDESAYAHLCRFNGNNPDPKDCNGYYICKDGQVLRVQKCPTGTQFSAKTRRCVRQLGLKADERCKTQTDSPYFNKFDEEVYKLTAEDLKELQTGGQNDPLCIHPEGFNANSEGTNRKDRCTKYLECKRGRLLPGRRDCPAGLTYDSGLRHCGWPKDNTNHECRALDADTPRLNNFCRRRFLEGEFKTGITQLFQSVRHPCKVFIICSRPYEHKFGTCPAGLSFHPTERKCKKHDLVPGCGGRGYQEFA